MSNSTSEDILKHIINDIVTRATHALKRRKLDNVKSKFYNGKIYNKYKIVGFILLY